MNELFNPLSYEMKYRQFCIINQVISQDNIPMNIITQLNTIFPADKLINVISNLLCKIYKDKIMSKDQNNPEINCEPYSIALDGDKLNQLQNDFKKNHKDIYEENRQMADEALRVLCAAYKKYDRLPADISPENIENDLVYIGLTGMIDPVREEVIPAIRECLSAGIRPVMITGDHKDTAVAIAKQIGIIKSADEAITGSELDLISEEDFDVTKYSVYARVKPEHKTRIVNAWKAKGAITAMTGDGVNDAPSIKSADIGIGMGITGTDVTKNVADMILVDDNFATIVRAVEEGRRIYDNIRKSIQFLLSSNMSEVFAIFVSSLMGFTLLKPVHLLFVNLITDCLPALALGMEEAEDNIMKRKPRDSRESIFAGGMVFDVAFGGILIGLLTVVSYFMGIYLETGSIRIMASDLGMTMAFLTLNMCEIFHSYNMRSLTKSIFTLHNHNKYLWGSLIMAFVIVTFVWICVTWFKGIPLGNWYRGTGYSLC